MVTARPSDGTVRVAGEDGDGETTALTLVDVVEVKVEDPGKLLWSSQRARDAAGFDQFRSVLYHGDPDAGVLVAAGTHQSIDGRSQSNAVTLRAERRAVSFAAAELEAGLGVDADEVRSSSPVRLAVFAGDGVLAFRRVDDLAGVVVDEELVDEIRDV